MRSRYASILAFLLVLAGLQACATPQAGDAAAAIPSTSVRGSSASHWTLFPQPVSVEVAGARLPVQATEEGMASWYGDPFHGRQTANGEVFDQYALTAAHPSLTLPSLARVTRLDTGASVVVRINDRGPFADGRVIDLSRGAAEALDFVHEGLAEVRVEILGPADPEDRAAQSQIVRGPGVRSKDI